MKATFYPSFFKSLLYTIALYYSLSLLSSYEWYWAGYVLSILFAIGVIKGIFLLSASSRHQSRQLDFDTFSKVPSTDYGSSSLAKPGDAFVEALRNKSGFYLGFFSGLPFFFDPFAKGNGHCITYAPSRSGKTSCISISAALHWLDGNLFMPVIKGDIAYIASDFRARSGHIVLIWNPYNVFNMGGMKFNPLIILIIDIKFNRARKLHDYALLIARVLVTDNPQDKDPFFRTGGRRFVVALLLFLAVFAKRSCHLPGLRNLIWSSTETKKKIANTLKYSSRFRGLLQGYGNHLEELLHPAYIKTFGPMRDYAIEVTMIYDDQTEFGKSLIDFRFDPRIFLSGKTTFFPVLPEDKLDTHGHVIGLMTAIYFELIGGSQTRNKTMFMLEEFGSLGVIPNLKKAVTLLPEKGSRVWINTQSRRQLIELYGENLTKLFEDQTSMIQQWAIRDPDDKKRWSERAGKKTVKTFNLHFDPHEPSSPWKPTISETERPVLLPDQVGSAPPTKQFVSIGGHAVIVGDLVPYYQLEPWRSEAEINPLHPDGYPVDQPVIYDLREA